MIVIPGYEIREQVYTSNNSLIYRGHRHSDQQPVIIKLCQEFYPTLEKLECYQREYDILSSLDLPGVIKVHELVITDNRPYIVLEDFGAISLSLLKIAGKLSLIDFLKLALAIVEIIGAIHQAKVIHKDLNPSNIVINSDTQTIKIIDFGLATFSEQETQVFTNPNTLEGTLPYIAPEQTGRMNRIIDYRSDFYALGVTFYELLSGRLPFASQDYLQLVHCHIAQQPPPVYQLAKDMYSGSEQQQVLKIISDIINKLLAKNAEERYQSVQGLQYDLRYCYQQLVDRQITNTVDHSPIDDFSLAKYDFTNQLQITQKLYGRESELNQLLAAFEAVNADSQHLGEASTAQTSDQKIAKLILISGYAGIGKSVLVREIYKPVTARNGIFIAGKYDQYHQDLPYSAVNQALNEFCNYVLTESEANLEQWRHKIQQAVEDNGQVLVDFIPNLQLIIGKQKEIAQLNAIESQRRFNLVFQRFIEAVCTWEHPLVIFLDDLQWADAASLNLLNLLINNETLSHCLIIGAYRNNEVGDDHPFNEIIHAVRQHHTGVELELNPLNQEQILHLIAESLSSSVTDCEPLANLVYLKTQGNPFFTIEFLKSIYRQGLLYFDVVTVGDGLGTWHWQLDEIAACNISDNVIDLMVDEIKRLNKLSKDLLQVAACIGNTFDLAILVVLFDNDVEHILDGLSSLLKIRLILPLSQRHLSCQINGKISDKAQYKQARKIKFRFSHDRIQQAAYSLLEPQEKQIIHFRIGKLRYGWTDASELDNEIFEITSHLNYGLEFIQQNPTLVKVNRLVAQLNLKAGQQAKKATAFAASLKYLETSAICATATCWEEDYHFSFDLYRELAEAQYLTGNHEQAQQTINSLLKNAQFLEHQIQAFCLLKNLQATQGRNYGEVLRLGLTLTAQVGLNFPVAPQQQQQAITAQLEAIHARLAQHRAIADLIHLPVMQNRQARLKMQLCMEFYEAAFYNGASQLILLTGLNLVNLSLEFGNSHESSFGYVLYGMYLVEQNDYQQGYEFGSLALKVLDKLNDLVMLPKVRNLFCNYINYYRNSFRENASYYCQNIQICRNNGEIVFGVWAAVFYIWSLFLSGTSLSKIYQESETYWQFVQQTNDLKMIKVFQMLQIVILNLQGKIQDKPALKRINLQASQSLKFWREHNFINGQTWYALLRCQVLYTYGYYHQAVQTIKNYACELAPNIIMFPISQYYVYYPLALIALYASASSNQQAAFQQAEFATVIAESLQNLERWQQHCPQNFQQQYLLLKAEWAAIEGQTLLAMDLYDQAIATAHRHQLMDQEALANELAGKFWLRQNKLEFAGIYLRRARYQYQLWGANGKADDLAKKYADLLAESPYVKVSPRITSTNRASSTKNLGLDLTSILEVSQTLIAEIKLEKLLEKIMIIVIENAGAEFGYLILKHQQKWVIQVSGRIENQAIKIQSALDSCVPTEDLNSVSDCLPNTIINYVARTNQAVVLDDACTADRFSGDRYINQHQPKSILCLPLMHQGELLGLLYLENNLIRGAFTQDRLKILQIITTQAAISLENAHLYKQLETYSKTLETKVKLRTEELQLAKEAADAANRAKSEFLSNMSHELRTPLNAILGFTQIMSRDPRINPEQRENLEIINRSGEHLLTLINDILDLSKIESGGITLNSSSFDLYSLLSTLEQMLRGKALSKNLELIFDLSPNLPQYIQADGNKLRQVLINLLSNAIKFTVKGGITLRAELKHHLSNLSISSYDSSDHNIDHSSDDSSSELTHPNLNLANRTDTVIRFEIEDTGVGIAAEDLETIFDPFVQTQTGRSFTEGTGLGLAISRKFVDLMGGELTINSQLNQGTLVQFLLPVQLAQADQIDRPVQPRKIIRLNSDQEYRILIAEDREANRQLLVKLLTPLGFRLKEAVHGRDAIAIWEEWSPQLILMDMRMPVMDGYAATKYIKQHLKGQATVIIALTASVFSNEKNLILSAGCDDFLHKPFRDDILLEKIAQHLGLSYIYEELEPESLDVPSVQAQLVTPEALQVMPFDWIERMYEAANQADAEVLLQLIEELPPEQGHIAVALQSIINDFGFDRIIELTRIEEVN